MRVACQEASYSCLMALSEGAYFLHASRKLKKQLHECCLLAATHINSLTLCRELCGLLDQTLEDIDLGELATMDGIIKTVRIKLRSGPDILSRHRLQMRRQQIIGEYTLKRAAENLRVAKVAFSLEQAT